MGTMDAETIKQFALDQGLDLCGIANIDRFEEARRNMHPASIFPEAKSVVVVARRIPRDRLSWCRAPCGSASSSAMSPPPSESVRCQ